MPIDARIALGVEPVKMPDFAQLAVQRSAVMNNMAEMASNQRALNEQNTLAQLMQDPSFSFDNPESIGKLVSRAPNLAPVVVKNYQDMRAARTAAEVAAQKQREDQRTAGLRHVASLSSTDAAVADIRAKVDSGELPPEAGAALEAKILGAKSWGEAKLSLYEQLMAEADPSKMLEQEVDQLDTGTELIDRTRRKFAMPGEGFTVLGSTTKKMSLVEQAAADAASQNAATSARLASKLDALPEDSAGVTRVIDPYTGKVVQEIQGAPKLGGTTAATKASTKAAGIEQFNTALSAMRNAYIKLDELGGLVVSGKPGDINPLTGKVDPKGRNVFENMNRFAAATEAGQFVEGSLGDPKQTERDNINNLRFALINSIKTMQDVGAKSLDSNVELQNALKTLSNPSQSRESVASTLATIDKIFRAEVAKLPDDAAAASGHPKEIQDILNEYNKR